MDGVKNMSSYLTEVAPALLRTRPGANVVLECISLGDAKTRKQIARGMKDDILEFMNHAYGTVPICSLVTSAQFAFWRLVFGIWRLAFGIWVFGIWHLVSGV